MNINLISGQSGSGKSLALYDIARTEIQKKKKVLFISFENTALNILQNIFINNEEYWYNQSSLNKYLTRIYCKPDITEKKFIQLLNKYKNRDIVLIDTIQVSDFIDGKNIYKKLHSYKYNEESIAFATVQIKLNYQNE